MIEEKKAQKLISVAKMYYETGNSQDEIAKKIGVSRPMVSKLLAQARDVGIVTIKINEFKSRKQELSEIILKNFSLNEVCVIDSDVNKRNEFGHEMYLAVSSFFAVNKDLNVGVGCGSTLGLLCDEFEQNEKLMLNGDVCPLIGGFKATFKSYHTNELVRIISENTGLYANYLYLPALLSSSDEKKLYKESELYMQTERMWRSLDTALINISSLYAPPDLATSARFGKKLTSEKAVGRFLAHYYDINGNIIYANEDNVVQIDTEDLCSIKEVVAMCSNAVDEKSVIGALNTNVFSKLILSEELAEAIVKYLKI